MVTHRRYYFEHPGPWTNGSDAWDQTLELLRYQAENRWWYDDPHVEGEPFGRLAFAFTVSGDDQWLCHRRAMGLASAVYRKLGLNRYSIPTPLWEPLEHPSVTRVQRAWQRAQEEVDELTKNIHL